MRGNVKESLSTRERLAEGLEAWNERLAGKFLFCFKMAFMRRDLLQSPS